MPIQFGQVLSGAGAGAMAGSSAGPWGTAIGAGAGGVAGLLSGLFGGSGGSGAGEATRAGNIVQSAANQGKDILQQWYDTATASEKPYLQLGSGAAQTLGGLYNLPGYAAIDPTKALEATPGYRFLADQGAKGLTRAGAASGLTGSGALGAGLVDYGQKLAQSYAWQPYVNELNTMQAGGQHAADIIGGWAMGAGSGQANLGMQGAEAQAQAIMNSLALNQMQQGRQESTFGSMLGLGIGAYGSGLFNKSGGGLGNSGSGSSWTMKGSDLFGGGGGFNLL